MSDKYHVYRPLLDLIGLTNMATGGRRETLCARIARNHGADCLFCRIIAFALREPDHCSRQIKD